MRYLFILLTSFFIVVVNPVAGQDESKALVSFHNGVVFVGVDNRFRVVIQQHEPVSIDQLQGVLLTYGEVKEPEPIPLEISKDSYGFTLRPTEPGIVEITITLQDGIKEQYNFRTQFITATARVGGFGPNTTTPVNTNVFKSQMGLYAQIEGFDICGSCNVLSFELIYISPKKNVEIITNSGGNWEPKTTELIRAAQPGDRCIFTKIHYRCPGAQFDQLGETLSFELR